MQCNFHNASCFKDIIRNISTLKCLKTIWPTLYILLSRVLTLSQMFPAMFKPREICNFIQGTGTFHLVAYQWRHITFIPSSCYNFQNIGWYIRERGRKLTTYLASHYIVYNSLYCSLVMEHDYSLPFAARCVAGDVPVKRKRTGDPNDPRKYNNNILYKK